MKKASLIILAIWGVVTCAATISGLNSATSPYTSVGVLQGIPVSSTAPNDNEVLTYDAGAGVWAPAAVAAGTVTSVAMSVPSFLSVAGSPITGSGTLAVTLSGTALPVANGGTGLTAGTSGGVPYYSAEGTIASSGALTQYAVVLGGGAGAAPNVVSGVGTSGQVLTSNGAGANPTWQDAPGTQLANPTDIQNCSLAASVAANALTVALKTADGSDPSAGSPCKIAFRDATLTTGTYATVSVTAALSVVVSNGSSLGGTASVNSNVMVYAVNNAGTVVLAVGRNIYQYKDSDIVSTTAEGGAGAADSASVLYSAATQTSKAARLLGRVQVTPAASFAYSASPTAIQNMPLPVFKTEWYTCTPPSGGWGGSAAYTGRCQRDGDTLNAQFKVDSGSGPTNTVFWVDLPDSMVIDTNKYIHTTTLAAPFSGGTCMAINNGVSNYPCVALWGANTQIKARIHEVSGSNIIANTDVTVSVPFTFGTSDAVHISVEGIPIVGWSLYGP